VYEPRGFLQKVIADLVVRAKQLRLPDVRPALTEVRGALTEFRGALTEFRRAVRGPLHRIAAAPVARGALVAVGAALSRPIEGWQALRATLRSTRLGRSADGLIVIPLLGLALVLGVFAATAATKSSDPPGEVSPLSPAANVSEEDTPPEVVTETIRRDGKTVRIVRYEQKPGRVETVSGRSVTVPVTTPGSPVTTTVHDTRTHVVTVTNEVTTTEVVTSTETVTETIILDEDDDGGPPPDPGQP
jgi:hypothetical protein